jgi:tyrosyl-tRNA synthetase
LEHGANPRDIKLRLAHIITALYHGKEKAEQANIYYDAAFGRKAIPEQVPELLISMEKDRLGDVILILINEGFVQSKSEFLRLLKQGGISISGERLSEDELDRVLISGEVMRIGKKKFIRFIK